MVLSTDRLDRIEEGYEAHVDPVNACCPKNDARQSGFYSVLQTGRIIGLPANGTPPDG